MLLVVDFLEPLQQEFTSSLRTQRVTGAKLQIVHVAAKLVQAADGLAAERTAQRGRKQGLEQAYPVLAGKDTELRERLVPDATFGNGHRAQKGRVVIVVDPQAKPGAQILDLGAVKETGATGNLVRNSRLA